jgi:predicted phage tail protein
MQSTDIVGNKGGKGGGSSGGYSEAPNTLRSKAIARLIDLISEGPTVGVVGGDKGIYLDNVPLQNADGTYNFNGVKTYERTGLPTQDIIPGFAASENEIAVSPSDVTFPISRTIVVNDANVNAVRVTVGVQSLTSVDTSSGNVKGSTATLEIYMKTYTGAYTLVSTVVFDGKTNSPYERSIRIDLPAGGSPWSIKVVRTSPDETSGTINNATVFPHYTEIVDARLSYPDSALVGFEIDSELFGSTIKERTYKYRGLIMSIPSNYDPVTRVYTGLWDGTFKEAWTNNPAWVLYALITNPRFGLGDVIQASAVDKFGLYSIGQYCDGLVPDGLGGTEPRYTFNGVLRTREDAIKVLDTIASTFRGMIYWGSGSVMATIDAPSSPVKLVTAANVIDGNFEYAGSSLQTRCSSVAVSWNDPLDLGKQSVLIVQKDDLIQKFGDRRKDIAAVGCTSRGQAHRIADWVLFTEAYETETVTYQAALDHADVRPGQTILLADPAYAGTRLGGRVVSATQSGIINLDAPVTFTGSATYQISTVKKIGEVVSGTIAPVPKNLLLWTDDYTNAYWTKAGVTTSSGAIQTPVGASSSVILVEDSISGFKSIKTPTNIKVYAGNLYTFSWYAKRSSGVRHLSATLNTMFDTASVSYNFTTGTPLVAATSVNVTASMVAVGSGWYRCSITAPAITTGSAYLRISLAIGSNGYTPAYQGDGASGFYVCGTQFELGLNAGTYVANTSTVNLIGDFSTITTSTAFADDNSTPLNGSLWIVSSSDVQPRTFRVIANLEKKKNLYEITAMVQAPGKYDYVERNRPLPVTTSAKYPTGQIAVPTGLTVSAYRKQDAGSASKLTYIVGWNRVVDPRVSGYRLWMKETGEPDRLVWDGAETSTEVTARTNKSASTVLTLRSVTLGGVLSLPVATTFASGGTFVAPPTPTNWSATPGAGHIEFNGDFSPSTDFKEFAIYGSSTLGGTYVKVGATPVSSFIRTIAAGDPYNYYKISAVDFSGLESPASTPINANAISPVGTATPAVPTGVSVTSTLITPQQSRVVVDWADNTEGNITGYQVSISENGGNAVVYNCTASIYAHLTLPATAISVKIRAVNTFGNTSAYTTLYSHTAISDTTPPAVPVGLAATGGFGSIFLKWTANTEGDFSKYELYESANTTAPTSGSAATYVTDATFFSTTGLGDGVSRYYWIRGVDFSGNKSAWSSMVTGTTVVLEATQGVPGVATGLALATATSGVYDASMTASWTAGANAVAYEIGVTKSGGVESIYGAGTSPYIFSVSRGVSYSVRVRSISNLGVKSAWTTPVVLVAAVDSVAPAVPSGLTIQAGFGTLWASWTANTEPDFLRYELYESASTTAPLAGTAATYSIGSTSYGITGLATGVTRNYWLRSVDTSGNKSAWSAMVSGSTVTLEGTQGAPSAATGIALSTALVAPASASVTATWTAGANAVAYEVGVTPSGGTESISVTGNSPYVFSAIRAVSYSVRVRSISNLGVKSAWTTPAVLTAAVDSVAPTVPTSTVATGGFGFITLSWSLPVDADFLQFEIVVQPSANTTTPLSNAVPSFVTASNSYVVGNLSGAATRNFWVRSVDTSGNKSAWTAMFSGSTVTTSSFLTTPAIAGLIDATSFASGVAPVEIFSALPTTGNYAGRQVFLTTDSKLYRHTGTPTGSAGFTRATDGADIIANSITAGQIHAGAIGADQIAANAISASKLFLGDTSNLWHDYDFLDPTLYYTVDGAVFTIVPTTNAYMGTNYINIASDATARSVTTAWQAAEQGTDYLFEGRAWVLTPTAGLYGELWVEFGTVGSDGVTVTVGQQLLIGSSSVAITNPLSRVVRASTKTNSDEKRYRFVMKKSAVAGSPVRFGGFIVRRRMTGELVVDGSITATKILAGSITANEISGATITGDKLAANTITADRIVTSSITATQLAAQTITADKIAANTITADQIASNTITAKNLLLTDFSNLFLNPNFSGGKDDGWVPDLTNTSVVTKTGTTGILGTMPAQYVRKVTKSLAAVGNVLGVFQDGYLPCYAGQQFHLEYSFASDSTSAFGAGFRVTQVATDGTVTTATGPWTTVVVGVSGWTTVTYDYTVPANTSSIRIGFGLRGPMVSGTDYIYVTNFVCRLRNNASLIVDGAISANQILSASITGDRLVANTITAAQIAATTITATQIAANTITAGQIAANTITAGQIAANTISANLLTIGMRNTQVESIEFEHNSPSANSVAWTAGTIRYVSDATTYTVASVAVSAGNAAWTSGVLYIYWVQGSTTLSTTTDATVAWATNNVVLAIYKGAADLNSSVGRTIIDGGKIKTQTITASQITAGTITANEILATSITGDRLVANTITAAQIAATTITATQIAANTITATQIAANTITTNLLKINARGIVSESILFEHNKPSANSVSWTSGSLRYITNAQTYTNAVVNITAGNAAWTTGTLYIYWAQGATTLSSTTVAGTAQSANNVVLAAYKGGTDLTSNVSQTIIDGSTIKTGTITADRLVAGSITANYLNVDWLSGNRISASYLNIDSLLSLNTSAGLNYGKSNVGDDATDGIYFGIDGTGNFGLAASRTSVSGAKQALKLSKATGLKLRNANHVISGTTLPVSVTKTAAATVVALPAGTKTISLNLMGGGAGGNGVTSSNTTIPGTAGGDTVVKIYDGATLKLTYTAAGGVATGNTTANGQNSALATGGTAAHYSSTLAQAGSLGSGGGGGAEYTQIQTGRDTYTDYFYAGKGGLAGSTVVVDSIDVSSYTSPSIEVTSVGAGGSGGSGTTYGSGAAGGSGRVVYTYTTATDIIADVVPLTPTATGTFSKPSGGAVQSFPALGAGYWVLSTGTADVPLNMTSITVSAGVLVYANVPTTVSFFSDSTPTYTPNGNVRTVYYTFYSMGSWGA